MMIERSRDILKAVFGYDDFISLQREVIENVLRGRDTLAVMPTGGGKSLCYQIPALIFEGLTIVVSPLISLMKDQVEQLAELEVPAALLNSSLSPRDYRANVERIRRGEAKLLYVAPETLLKQNVLVLFETVPVACIAIDEAHCISEWGPDFRPEYRQLAEVRTRMPEAVCIALTATATARVREDIRTCLGFDDSNQFLASFNRENLLLRVLPKEDPLRQTHTFLNRFANESGIIYCATRRQVDDLCAGLCSQGFSAAPYHAGLAEEDRNRNQQRFAKDEVRIMVATIAFGMGINKSNIRFVLHYDLPQNLESYYQEIGRAGRDGMRAECLLLFSYADIQKIKFFINKKEGQEKRAANLQLNALVQFAESDVCRRIPLLKYFGEAFPDENCDLCDHCLAGERESTDITIPAQKFLSCVKRTGECFGAMHIIDVLRGSRADKVLQRRHHELSTYGIGRELSRKQWQQLARQLLHRGLLTQDSEFGGLSLTARAWEVLKGKEIVLGRMDSADEPETPREEAAGDGVFHYDRQLFEILRQKRKELADAAGVPPYVIFSDRTLAEMAAYLPQGAESMLAIHGVGRVKLEKYGQTFISLIEDYCREHPVVKGSRIPERRLPKSLASGQKRRHIIIGDAYKSGQSVEDLAKTFNVKQNTVLDNLLEYCREGYSLRSEALLPLITVPDQQLTRAMDTFQELGADFLRPVFDALNGEIGYEDLKIMRLYHLSRQNPITRADGAADRNREQSKQIICLANSRKYSGCCIAGKELIEGRIGGWIRPVGGEATGELSVSDITMANGEVPKLLDVVTVHVSEGCPHAYQVENCRIAAEPWIWNGTLSGSRLPELCDDVDCLWINGYHSLNGLNDRMPVELAGKTLDSTLLFIRPEGLCILVEADARGLKKFRAKFTYKEAAYCLTVTDPVIETRYMRMEIGHYPVDSLQPYLTVSIGEPFEGFCYKLVAAVIL
jgi:ATP-dependent DNA helicase RecQ